jgi:hypothetical protein
MRREIRNSFSLICISETKGATILTLLARARNYLTLQLRSTAFCCFLVFSIALYISVNDELEDIWKKAVVTHFKVLSQHLPGGTEQDYKKISLRISSLWNWNRTSNLQSTKHEC